MADDKVIYLAFDNPEVKSATVTTVISCKNCTNKTWVIVITAPDTFPTVKCAVCGMVAARMGWVHDEQ